MSAGAKHMRRSPRYAPGSPHEVPSAHSAVESSHSSYSNTSSEEEAGPGKGDRVRLLTPHRHKAKGRRGFQMDPLPGGGGGGGGSNRRRYNWHWRKLSRLMVCLLLVPMFFIMLYMPLYSNVPQRQVPLPDWGYNTSRNIADYVLPDTDTTLLEPHGVCDNKTFLLIVVSTGVNNFAQRQTIRETWGNVTEFTYSLFARMHGHLKGRFLEPSEARLKYYSPYFHDQSSSLPPPPSQNTSRPPPVAPVVRVLFLIGRSKYESLMGNETLARVRREQELYNDMVQQDFVDTYNNLTLKSVFALKWLTRRCSHRVAYFMKCDDDTFVNVPNLLHYLLGGTMPLYNDTLEMYDTQTYQTKLSANRLNVTHNYLAGHLFCTSRPVANITNKWYIPYYMYPKEEYPAYLSGAGYIMSMDVVQPLYEAALNTTLIHFEDVYLTGMCASRIGLRRRHHPLFSYSRSKHLCTFKGTITQHEMKDDSLMEAYAFVMNQSIQCAPPGSFFKRVRLAKVNTCK